MKRTLRPDSSESVPAKPFRAWYRLSTTAWLALGCVVAPALYSAYWLGRTANRIERQSKVDEARPADVILVLGAAEYRGKPSPVYEARLKHALFLYLKHLAPKILTTGGAGGDPRFTEGEVGRTYLISRGVPAENILVEWEGESTVQSVAAAGEIMLQHNLRSCIVVSDGYHIYRVKRLLEARGVTVYGSPRPSRLDPGEAEQSWKYVRQAIGYLLWRLGIPL